MIDCYFVDSTHSNNWRNLRIHNADENLAYIEYDPTYVAPCSWPAKLASQVVFCFVRRSSFFFSLSPVFVCRVKRALSVRRKESSTQAF